MRHAHIVANERLGHQGSWGSAFGAGLKRHGWRVTSAPRPLPCDLLVLWGVRRREWIAAQRHAAGRMSVCILERGYVADRFAWTSVSFGGLLNGRAEFRGPFEDPSRWDKYFSHLMHPWRSSGEYALIMEQIPGDTAVFGVNLPDFYHRAKAAFARQMAVRVRPHPNLSPRQGKENIVSALRSLARDLDGAKVVVTWNSNSGVDAVLAGVPTIAIDRGSMAWDVTGHNLAAIPPTPDRTAWAHRIAWCQYSRDEMESGYAWDMITSGVDAKEAA